MIRHPARAGAVVPMVALLLVALLGMVAFAVDIGYICVVQKELQNAADSASLAAATQLLDRGALMGSPNASAAVANARDVAQQFSSLNKGGGVSLLLDRNSTNSPDGDIVCGRIEDPTVLNAPLDTSSTRFNSVRVRVRRNPDKNGALRLFFGPVLNKSTQNIVATATATYEDGVNGFRLARSGATHSKLLPFAVNLDWWNKAISGDSSMPDDWTYDPATGSYTPGGDGIKEINLFPTRVGAPGNFGTVDIGGANNSSSDIARQILEGPNQSDFDAVGGEIKLNAAGTLVLQGDTGISAGFKDELEAIRGQRRIIPIYNAVVGEGNNTYYTIVGWGGIIITDVQLTTGEKVLTIQPEYVQDPTAMRGGNGNTSFFVSKPLRITR